MKDSYVVWRKKQNIKPVVLSNKEKYYSDLRNIEDSWSGRVVSNPYQALIVCNTFIMEAVQELVNAMELFELGYFDCAYYSLRSAVDISTTIVFLSDMPEEDREKHFSAWKATENFPKQGEMIKQLSKHGNVFEDMKHKMPHFFTSAQTLSAEINKYVHKQGLQHFYISRNHPFNQQKTLDDFTKTFETYLQRCIGVVAVMRLAIDPFPILLMDEEIMYRFSDSLTEPYSDEFVEKYIKKDIISQYKNTDIYIEAHDFFMNYEKKTESVFDVSKFQYINSKKLDDISDQLHLLSKIDMACVLIVAASEKVVQVHCYDGLTTYFTDRRTNRTATSWSDMDFKAFVEAKDRFNQPYDDAYISVFKFAGEQFYIEHNEKLNADDVDTIVNRVSDGFEKCIQNVLTRSKTLR